MHHALLVPLVRSRAAFVRLFSKTTKLQSRNRTLVDNIHQQLSRRALLFQSAAVGFFVSQSILGPTTSLAFEPQENQGTEARNHDGRPFAPPDALLPAARCKLWIDRAHEASTALGSASTANEKRRLVQELETILVKERPKLFTGNEKVLNPSKSPLTAQITGSISSANKDQFQQNRQVLNVGNQVAAMLNQADVERQWGMLQFAETKRQEENDIRRALSYYTQQLEFADSYLLTAPKEERKALIRNDALPSLSAVITSDLDLRDLYRNQLLTAIDDATAEAQYQSKQKDVEISDLLELMDQAYTACSKWFDLIAPSDVEEAVRTIQQER